MNEIRIYKSLWQPIKIILLSMLFVLPCIYFLKYQPDYEPVLCWVGLIFFGLGPIFGISQLLDRRPKLIINEIGIFDRKLSDKTINWDVINDAYVREIHSQRILCLDVAEDFEPSRDSNRFRKVVSGLNKALGFQELNIAVSNLSVNEAKLLQLILMAKDADVSERSELLTTAWNN